MWLKKLSELVLTIMMLFSVLVTAFLAAGYVYSVLPQCYEVQSINGEPSSTIKCELVIGEDSNDKRV